MRTYHVALFLSISDVKLCGVSYTAREHVTLLLIFSQQKKTRRTYNTKAQLRNQKQNRKINILLQYLSHFCRDCFQLNRFANLLIVQNNCTHNKFIHICKFHNVFSIKILPFCT